MAKLTILKIKAVLWTDEQALLALDRFSCCGTVFRESYLPVRNGQDQECEKVWISKRGSFDSSCGQPEVNFETSCHTAWRLNSTMLYMSVTWFMSTVINDLCTLSNVETVFS